MSIIHLTNLRNYVNLTNSFYIDKLFFFYNLNMDKCVEKNL